MFQHITTDETYSYYMKKKSCFIFISMVRWHEIFCWDLRDSSTSVNEQSLGPTQRGRLMGLNSHGDVERYAHNSKEDNYVSYTSL